MSDDNMFSDIPMSDLSISYILLRQMLTALNPPSANLNEFIIRRQVAVDDLETMLITDLPDNWDSIIKSLIEKVESIYGKNSIENSPEAKLMFYKLKFRELVKIVLNKIPKDVVLEF